MIEMWIKPAYLAKAKLTLKKFDKIGHREVERSKMEAKKKEDELRLQKVITFSFFSFW